MAKKAKPKSKAVDPGDKGIPLPTPLVEFILLGPMDDRRQLQDSPLLGDVWIEFGKNPAAALDLLIAPYRGRDASFVALDLDQVLGDRSDHADISYLQGLVAARLPFKDVLTAVVPKTKWWTSKWKPDENGKPVHDIQSYSAQRLKDTLSKVKNSASDWFKRSRIQRDIVLSTLDRFISLTGLILWAGEQPARDRLQGTTPEQVDEILSLANEEDVSKLLDGVRKEMLAVGKAPTDKEPAQCYYWQVSCDRKAMPALTMSVAAVKADAAKTLFTVNCRDIAWAVIDSGIDGSHDAFQGGSKGSRIKRSFDFKRFRQIVSLGNAKPVIRKRNADELMKNPERLKTPPKDDKEAQEFLALLAEDARLRGPIHWGLVERFVEINPEVKPPTNHGTHVAGIIGANKKAAIETAAARPRKATGEILVNEDIADGMCPDITLFDFRVLGADIRDTEFAIIAALQFIRYLNDRDKFLAIHGANLSLSIPHDVRNFACGRTPICDECERLVENGVVVVAAAGNHGYKNFETKDGQYEGYTAFSITDPGNADSVITVGATHRFWPHTYGVSFFSSRGPTGDGRIKPDLVAPGERIRAPVPDESIEGGSWADLDGTSMAAPHVSGAAAMLMARYTELIGQPRRVKRLLCESATDLGREKSFQGHGMLDVLRAFQSL